MLEKFSLLSSNCILYDVLVPTTLFVDVHLFWLLELFKKDDSPIFVLLSPNSISN